MGYMRRPSIHDAFGFSACEFVDHYQSAATAVHANFLIPILHRAFMRRLIALVLILWLPLQAGSAVFAAGCVAHGLAQHVAAADAIPQDLQDHASTARQFTAPESAQADVAHPAGDAYAANNPACADGVDCCVIACGVFVSATTCALDTSEPATAPARHGDEAFTSAPASQPLEPPIVAT